MVEKDDGGQNVSSFGLDRRRCSENQVEMKADKEVEQHPRWRARNRLWHGK